jgi:hypothetical protein
MRLIRWTVLFLFPVELLSIFALCQRMPAAPGIVCGHVELEDTGAPAKGAVISLRPTEAPPVRIPTNGEYVVRNTTQTCMQPLTRAVHSGSAMCSQVIMSC